MNKNLKSMVLCVFALVCFVALSSFVLYQEQDTQMSLDSKVSLQGKRCSYTIGCDCSGFSAITNGEEWQKLICKRCGHPRKYHK